MKHMTFVPCIGVVAGVLAGGAGGAVYAQEREPLKMAYSAADREAGTIERVNAACPVALAPVIDGRRNTETIGFALLQGPLLSGKLDGWTREGLAELKGYGLQLSNAETHAEPSGNAIAMQAKLDRAYTWQVGFKIFSMVTMKITYLREGGVKQEKSYRAHGDKTNMWGAQAEHVTTLNYGLNNLLPAIAQDLKTVCEGGKLTEYAYVHPTVNTATK